MMKKFNQLLFISSLLLVLSTAQADLVLSQNSFITQGDPSIIGGSQSGSGFGFALNSANNELYISSLRYVHEGAIDSGAVHRLVGADGFPLIGHPHNKLIHQGHIANDSPELGDLFGNAVVAAKTKGGNESQLIIGVPAKKIIFDNAGLIHYIKSICDSCDGTVLTSSSYSQDTLGISGAAQSDELFGFVLATGDYNGDGFEDIAVGTPLGKAGAPPNNFHAGVVNTIMSAGPNGLSSDNSYYLTQNSSLLGVPNEGDRFGSALASGDFNGDGVDDLAIGVKGEAVDGHVNAGIVQVIYGVAESAAGQHDNGLRLDGNQIWSQNSLGIGGGAEDNDEFGGSLAAGDFNGDGVDDLVIGVKFEDIGGESNAGAVNIIYGSLGVGLTAANDLFISQDEPGFVGASEAEDFFGVTLAAGDLNNDGFDDLVIGASGEDISTTVDTGGVYVVFGSNSGLQFSNEYIITEGNLGGTQGLRELMRFGSSMTINDFDGDGLDDLAIATTAFPPTGEPSVSVIYQQIHQNIFVNGFED